MIISVEGNIGTGKSTFLRIIRDKYKDSNIIFLDEPLDKWLELKDTDGENILEASEAGWIPAESSGLGPGHGR